MRRQKSFRIENGSDLAIDLLLAVEFGDTSAQLVLIGVMRIALHVSLQPVLAYSASLPDDLDPDVATSPLLIQNGLLDHQTSNLLPGESLRKRAAKVSMIDADTAT